MSWWLVILACCVAWCVVSVPVALAVGRAFAAGARRSAASDAWSRTPLGVVTDDGTLRPVRRRVRVRYLSALAGRRAQSESA